MECFQKTLYWTVVIILIIALAPPTLGIGSVVVARGALTLYKNIFN